MPDSLEFHAASRVDTISISARRARWSLRQWLLAITALLLVLVSGLYGNYWWHTGRFLVSTDDAYVDAHSVLIAPKISGYIASVAVDDNQTVHAGDVIATIDPRDYQTALDQARADVVSVEAGIDTLNQQIAQQKLVSEEAQQLVGSDQAAQTYSQQNFQRATTLAHLGAGSVQAEQQATADIREKQATFAHDTTAVAAAGKQTAVLEAQLAQAKASLAQKQAVEAQAGLNLSYSVLRAQFDGTIGARTVTEGQYVQPGTQLMAIVPLHNVYVTANFKETQLTDVRPGQRVTFKVDTYPGVTVHGYVGSISPASGQQFALLPPDNATGNFTKIVQRVPVKIYIDKNDPLSGMLRPGMSVEPTIDTKSVAAVERASSPS
jgi:membrane fusion protein (multidrug efflux system)